MKRVMRQRLLTGAILLLGLCLGMRAGWSADSAPLPKTSRLTADQQKAALDFAREHHPQLNALILRLKKRDPAEYHEALEDVFKTSERLQRLEARDRARYEVELELWKVGSRIRLLAARMAADRSPELEKQLRDLLGERNDLRLQQLALERERLTSRLERIESQVSQLSSEREARIEREVERLRKSVRARTARVPKKSAGKAPSDRGRKDRAEQTPEASGPQRPAQRAPDSG